MASTTLQAGSTGVGDTTTHCPTNHTMQSPCSFQTKLKTKRNPQGGQEESREQWKVLAKLPRLQAGTCTHAQGGTLSCRSRHAVQPHGPGLGRDEAKGSPLPQPGVDDCTNLGGSGLTISRSVRLLTVSLLGQTSTRVPRGRQE